MKNCKYIISLLIVSIILSISELHAQISLPSIFTNHMVLQRNSDVDFWGYGTPGETISIIPQWLNGDTIYTKVGNMGKWVVSMKTHEAGGPYTIKFIGSSQLMLEDVLLGEVWLCSGQSNMEWCASYGIKNGEEEIKNAYCPNLRIFHLPKVASSFPQENCSANWNICTSQTMPNTSATAYFFGRNLIQELNVPVGIIVASWGGTPAEVWTPKELVMSDPILSDYTYQVTTWWPVEAGSLFNSMIHPIMPYKIAGCIWYQGEANHTRAISYARLMQTMIKSWRTGFNYDFPFYFVQIAPFQYFSNDNGPAILREQQALLPKMIDRVMMVNVSDLVEDVKDIHPRDKKGIASRLSNLALDDNYHKYVGCYESPIYKSFTCKENRIIISFESKMKGLKIGDKDIKGLYMAGKDKIWNKATAYIDKEKLVIPIEGIEEPVSIRYCFSDDGIGNLLSLDGVPVAPFRIDNIIIK